MSIDLKKLVMADRRVAGDRCEAQNAYLVWASVGASVCLAAAFGIFGGRILAVAAVAWGAWLAVDVLFALVRRRPAGGGSLVFAMLFALMCPPAIPLWMVGTGAAFGCLFAKEVFGGTGHHVFNPVLVGKAFLVFSYPSICTGHYFGHLFGALQGDAWIAASAVTILAGLLLAFRSRGSVWIYSGILMGLAGTGAAVEAAGALPFGSQLELLVSNGTLLGICLLAADPAGAPKNKHARLLFGITIGVCAVVMRSLSTYSEAMMCAVLLGNLCAPTFDIMAREEHGNQQTP